MLLTLLSVSPVFVGLYNPCFALVAVNNFRALLKIQPNVSLWREIKREENKKIEFLEVPVTSSDTTKKTPKFHLIKGKETLAQIAAKYKIPQRDLMKWNKLTTAKVSPNQKILLYNPDSTEQTADEQLDKNLSAQSAQSDKSPQKTGNPNDRSNVSSEELQALLNKMNYQPTVITKKGTEIKVIQEQPIPSQIKDSRQREKAKADSAFKAREIEEKIEKLKERARTDSLARIKADRDKKKNEMLQRKKEKMKADSLAKAEKEKQRIAILEKARADSLARAEEEKRINAIKEKAIADSLARVKAEEDKKKRIREKSKADSLAKVNAIQKKDSLERVKMEQEKIRKEAEAKLTAGNQNSKPNSKTTSTGKTTENPVSKDGRGNINAEDVAALLKKLNVNTAQKVQYTQQIGIQVSGEDDLNNDQMVRLAFFYDKDMIRAEEREFHSYVVGTKETLKIEEKKDTAVFIKREENPQDVKPVQNMEPKPVESKKPNDNNPDEKKKPVSDKSEEKKPDEKKNPVSDKSEEKKPVVNPTPSLEKPADTKIKENPKSSQKESSETDTTSTEKQTDKKSGIEKTVYGEIEEKGIAYALLGKEIEQDGLKIIHASAPVGTTIKITNPLVDKSVFAKVCSNEMAKIPEKDVIVQLNKKVSEKLGLKNKFVFVTLTYMGNKPKE